MFQSWQSCVFVQAGVSDHDADTEVSAEPLVLLACWRALRSMSLVDWSLMAHGSRDRST
jgi:hypothetical protein